MTGTTTEDRLHSVGDAGAYVPYARKHTERARQKTDASLRLSDLWPKPDWSKWITAERSVDVVSHLAMYYEGLRTSPHGDGVFGVSGSEWDKAYRLGVTSMIRLFSATKAEADLQTLGERYCVLLGLSKENLHKDVRLNAAYWSLGRGSGRKISSPFAQTLRSYSLSKWLPKMGWRGGECGLLKVCIVPVMMNDGRWRVAHIEGEHYCFLEVGEVKDEGHAVELAQERIKKSLDRTGTRRAVKEDLRRVGPIARQGNRNISSETLIEAFGLRAIQFGNVLSDKERQGWLNDAYDALSDLATITGFKKKWIGLGGLALAIGARGVGGSMAHYEPLLKVINLTRENGAGSLAHEWSHALDHRIAKTLNLLTGGFAIERINEYSLEEKTYTEKQKELTKILREIRKYSFPRYGPLGEQSNFRKAAAQISAGHRAGNYWVAPEEMFARGFEAFIEDSLESLNMSSPWLVHGTREDDYDLAIVRGHPYPLGDERKKLNAHYRTLIGVLGG